MRVALHLPPAGTDSIRREWETEIFGHEILIKRWSVGHVLEVGHLRLCMDVEKDEAAAAAAVAAIVGRC